MTQKTIKALYKQPVNYKLIRDGYKTINGAINAQDGMPKVLELPTPSEVYTTDLQYTVDTNINGAPVINFNQFTLPDDETCVSKQYCYAPKGNSYDYKSKEEVEYSYINTSSYSVVGSPTIDTTSGIVTNFSNSSYLITGKSPSGTVKSYEVVLKFKTSSFNDGRLIGNYANNIHSIQVEVPSSSENKMWWGHPSSSYSWQAINPNYVVEQNTWYWIKGVYDSNTSKLIVYMHKENEDYINCGELNVTGCGWNEDIEIGCDQGGGGATGAYIDLSESYIKINDNYWWKPWIKETRIEEVVTPILGMLDPSVTTDNWQQNQNYKLYQLKNQNNTDTLQLTENNITDITQKYKQYVQQITIPARAYKWYYNGIPQYTYERFLSHGATITNGVATNFDLGSVETYPLRYMSSYTNETLAVFNIETGNISTDCVFFDMYSNYESEASILFAIRNGKFSYNSYEDPTTIVSGLTNLSSNTKYWVALYLSVTEQKIELYLLADNDYQKENLPSISSWTKELTFTITNPETVYCYSYVGAQYIQTQQLNGFTGKIYLYNIFATSQLTTSYDYMCWEPYEYGGYQYDWYANKSLYVYNENENYADTLDFSDSWVNVTSNWKTQKQYINPNVCLMPTDGGETITHYTANGILSGTVSFDESTGIMGNCNSTNYLSLPNAFLPGTNNWEINLKVKTPSTQGEMHYLMGSLSSYYWTVGGELSANNKFGFGITSTGESWDIAWLGAQTVSSPNTWYWIRLSFNGTEYKFELSTDGTNYALEGSVVNSTPIYQDSYDSIIHLGTQATHYTYWTGEIDLSQCNIKINNNMWWTGTTVVTNEHQYIFPSGEYMSGCLYSYNDEGQQHNFDVYYDSNYTQPILVSSGTSYAGGTKVDTITIPAHRTWEYTSGGNWSKITYVDTSYSNYTYTSGNLVLTEYTGSDTDVILPNAVI